MTVTSASPGRAAAVRALERVETDDAFADLALESEIANRGLGARDAALATELTFGTLRWQRYLDWILTPHSRRSIDRLDPRVRILLRLAAYQIVFLQRIPAFAAVSEAVTLARERARRGTPEFVNAKMNVIRFGLSYQFDSYGWGKGPVTAKY